jgi:hypothetical protein
MAPCSNSGRLFINGSYYGLYVVEDHVGHGLVKDFFPGNSDGNLFKGGSPPDQNNNVPDAARLQRFKSATDIASMTGLIDPQTAKKLRLSGVDGLVRGSLTPVGDGIRLTIQVIAVETAQIVGAARGVVPKTSAMDNLGGAIKDSPEGSAPGPKAGSAPSGSGAAKRGKYVSEDGTLRVTLQLFRKSDSDSTAKAAFLVENLSGRAVTVCWESIRAVSEAGEEWTRNEATGIPMCGGTHTHFSDLGPSSSLTAFGTFYPRNAKATGTTFALLGTLRVSDSSKKSWVSTPSFRDVPSGL